MASTRYCSSQNFTHGHTHSLQPSESQKTPGEVDHPPSIPNKSFECPEQDFNPLSTKSISIDGSKITLRSRELRNIIADVLNKYLDHTQEINWVLTEPVIDKPYEMVLWHWVELWEATGSTGSTRGSERSRELLRDFLEHISNLDPQGVKLAESIAIVTKIIVNSLWQLFRPGTWVVSKPYLDEPQYFRVRDTYHRDTCKDIEGENYQRSFVVLAWTLGSTGTELRQEHYEFFIGYEYSRDEKTITDLPCYPVAHHRDNKDHHRSQSVEALETQVGERGKLFWKFCKGFSKPKHHRYEGDLLYYQNERAERMDLEFLEVSDLVHFSKRVNHECLNRGHPAKKGLKSERCEDRT